MILLLAQSQQFALIPSVFTFVSGVLIVSFFLCGAGIHGCWHRNDITCEESLGTAVWLGSETDLSIRN